MVDLFRLGIGFVLLAVMFPVVDSIEDTETGLITLFTWFTGVILVFLSAMQTKRAPRGGS